MQQLLDESAETDSSGAGIETFAIRIRGVRDTRPGYRFDSQKFAQREFKAHV
jgi:hypothetical protein